MRLLSVLNLIFSVNPLTALVETILPLYSDDAKDIIERILQLAAQKGEEVPIEDGFELYGELVEIRRIHAEALPKYVRLFVLPTKANFWSAILLAFT